MLGVITTRDILAHPVITIRCFGWRVFFRALLAGHKQTFLSLLPKIDAMQGAGSRLSMLVQQCIDLELRAKRVYAAFAHAFADWPLANEFFGSLAQQEQNHADLLTLCLEAANRGSWLANCYNPWEEYLPHLEQHMQEVEASLPEVGSLDDALRLVVQIESGEINRVFQAILTTSDSAFVKKLAAFQRATEMHIAFVVRWLPTLSPQLIPASRELRTLFPRAQ